MIIEAIKIVINQGGNTPIVLEFDTDIESCCDKVSIFLAKADGSQIDHWSKSDVEIDGNVLTIPLYEQRTILYPAGLAYLCVKILDTDGIIVFYNDIICSIANRHDKTLLTEV